LELGPSPDPLSLSSTDGNVNFNLGTTNGAANPVTVDGGAARDLTIVLSSGSQFGGNGAQALASGGIGFELDQPTDSWSAALFMSLAERHALVLSDWTEADLIRLFGVCDDEEEESVDPEMRCAI